MLGNSIAMEPSLPPPAPPCLYLPIYRPDAPVPTYAVLQLLGFSPNPDPSAIAAAPAAESSSASGSISSCDEIPCKKLTAIMNPSPMKKTGSHTLSPASRRSGGGVAARVVATQAMAAEKERVVQTDAAKFREVVHRLTGAESGKERVQMEVSTKKVGGDGRNRARDQVSLLQRRKSNQALHRLLLDAAAAPLVPPPASASSSCRDSKPLVPSPVTPLSSDFDKLFCSNSSGSLSPAMATQAPSNASGAGMDTAKDSGFSFFPLHGGGGPRDQPTLLRLFPESPKAD